MSPIVMVAVLASLAAGCATIDYVGQSYPPTTQVELYFSEADVGRDYQVMGQIVATGDQYLSSARLQSRLMEKARESGADAVIIVNFDRVRLSNVQQVVETVTETKDDDEKTVERKTTHQDLSAEGAEIRALFIRYRAVGPLQADSTLRR